MVRIQFGEQARLGVLSILPRRQLKPAASSQIAGFSLQQTVSFYVLIEELSSLMWTEIITNKRVGSSFTFTLAQAKKSQLEHVFIPETMLVTHPAKAETPQVRISTSRANITENGSLRMVQFPSTSAAGYPTTVLCRTRAACSEMGSWLSPTHMDRANRSSITKFFSTHRDKIRI